MMRELGALRPDSEWYALHNGQKLPNPTAGDNEQLRAEIEELKTERDNLRPYAERMKLRLQLREAVRRGNQFLKVIQPIEEDVQRWHASNLRLIKENSGDEIAGSYSRAPGEESGDPSRTPQQKRIARRIRELEEMLDKVIDYQQPPFE